MAWESLKISVVKFPDADLLAFTTYPGFIYQSPGDIPADYYKEIRAHTNKPIAFTGIGWFSETEVPGWPSTEAEQAAFVNAFIAFVEEIDPEFVIWPFVYDGTMPVPFSTTGLVDTGGNPKQALGTWDNIDYGVILLS